MVDRVNVGHAVVDDATDFLETLVGAHGGDRVTLDQDVGACKQLQGFQGGSTGAENTLTTLDEALLVADLVADLDDVACDVVFEDFKSLFSLMC